MYKVALCVIIFCLCLCMLFITLGLQYTLCPERLHDASPAINETTLLPISYRSGVVVAGFEYDFKQLQSSLLQISKGGINLTSDWHAQDLTKLFVPKLNACAEFDNTRNCSLLNPFLAGSPSLPGVGQPCPSTQILTQITRKKLYFNWNQVGSMVQPFNHLLVYNGIVMNLTNYFGADSAFLGNTISEILADKVTQDVTLTAHSFPPLKNVMACLAQRYTVGYVEKETIGCMAKDIMLSTTLIIVLSVILSKFIMAVWFHWALSDRLVKPKPRANGDTKQKSLETKTSPNDLQTIILITCFSESEESIRNTLNSVVETRYPNSSSRKMRRK